MTKSNTKPILRLAGLFLAAPLLGACASAEGLDGDVGAPSAVELAPGEALRGKGPGKTAAAPSKGQAAMTPELRAAFIEAAQSNAGEAYRAAQEPSGAARFVHPAQGFEATIDGAEVRLASQKAGSWDLSLATTGIGCEGVSAPALPAGAVAIAGNRVAIARDSVREWYVNGPLGLEQGFTLERAPSCEGPKVITLKVGGSVAPALVDDDGDGRGQAVTLRTADGAAAARYTDLFVKDATGRRVEAWIRVKARELSLHVNDAGAVYPLQIDPLIATEEQKLTASDGAPVDWFGYSVALSGDTALVGAVFDDNKSGAAYVFTRAGGVWTEQQKLKASDGAPDDRFGISVALSGDTALVGAYFDDIGANVDQGSAYVFTRVDGVWTEKQKLTASDGAAGDSFGAPVALSGDTALVGAPVDDVGANVNQGSAYVFTFANGMWTEQQKLTASDGVANEHFCNTAALSGDTALLGAVNGDVGANINQGSAYVFTRTGGMWTEKQKLTAGDGAASDHFGTGVALSGDTALVGAFSDDVGANAAQGSVYVFTLDGGMWTEKQKLTAGDGVAGDVFGNVVALSGDTALVGATQADIGANADQGSAYVFTRAGGVWTERLKLTAGDGAANDLFGGSVALLGDTALVVAAQADVGANLDQGAAYVFVLRKSDGEQCAAGTECFSGHCVDGVCCDKPCDGAPCQACSIAQGALADGACAPLAGKACDDGDPCSQIDACDESGLCAGSNPVVCKGADACQLPGACDAKTGACAPPTGEVCSGGEGENSAPSVPSAVTLCKSGSECESGFCVDGVCCDTACDKPCHSCVIFPIIGKCTQAPAGVDLRHDCYPVENCLRTCGGNGQCIGAGPGTLCQPTRCTGRSQGLGPAYCAGVGEACPSGESVPFDCAPYACIEAFGACRSDCRTNDDCAEGAACDIDGTCVAPPAPPSASGCGLTGDERGGGGSQAAWLLGLAAIWRARRRRSARSRAPTRT